MSFHRLPQCESHSKSSSDDWKRHLNDGVWPMAASEGLIYPQQPRPCIILLPAEHIVQFHGKRNLCALANERLDVIQVRKVSPILSRQHSKVTHIENNTENLNDIIL